MSNFQASRPLCDRGYLRHWQGFTTPRACAIRERGAGVGMGPTRCRILARGLNMKPGARSGVQKTTSSCI